MRIGEVARLLGVEVHVLRHWDDVGAVVPDRAPSGQREYGEEHLHRLRVLQACQEAGMSLADIRKVLHRREPERLGAIERHLELIRRQRVQLEATERFLEHVVACEHDLLTRCESCSRFAESLSAGRSGIRRIPQTPSGRGTESGAHEVRDH
ncbi:MerR family transcriptional regulator [Arthrobacter sp. RAF14]|uniref:MerR family transcriptional regulator n=1 Tax=Arthrobacter sp. RAF14 TaxID=3233051 RepID=UPI003F8E890D